MEYFMMKQQNDIHDFDVLVAIDIGLNGGISFFDTVSGEVLAVYPMPSVKVTTSTGRNKGELDLDKLKHILEIPRVHGDTALVVMENVHAYPGQGSVATATLMEQKGIIRGMCAGLGYTEEFVEPKTWQKHYDMIPPKDLKGGSASKTKTLRKKWLKEKSLSVAKERFPDWVEKVGKSDGLSDALLIGEWYIKKEPQ